MPQCSTNTTGNSSRAGRLFASLRFGLFFCLLALQALPAAEWTIPVAGNAYRTLPEPGRLPVDRQGLLQWSEASEAYEIYFRVDRPAELELSLEASGPSELEVSVLDQDLHLPLEGSELREHPIGRVEVPDAGYVAVTIRGRAGQGMHYGPIRSLRVKSATEGLTLNYVKSKEVNMFYWGRRGPSVHLNYPLPPDRKIEYAYSELTVPEGEDTIGSYYMANGFAHGYFGIQVRSPGDRWVLFSVWSPHHTNNPSEIPEADRVEALAVGPGVTQRAFGGEGSGGQSFLRYPWRAGVTYCFLTQARPDGEGNTVYSAWFSEKGGPWRLMASFRRPKTDTWYRGFHSFLENFLTAYGHIERRSLHGNQWVCDVEGNWHAITQARVTVDATGRGEHRLDFDGGVTGSQFYMRNGGFFSQSVEPGIWVERSSIDDQKPAIDFSALPRE